jgi:hypothetical protein
MDGPSGGKRTAYARLKRWRAKHENMRKAYNSYNIARRASRRRDPRGRMLSSARERAKTKGVPCTITKDDIIMPDVCPILGLPLQVNDTKAGPNSPSLDEIRPGLGYVPDNVQVISHRANVLKNNATVEELECVLEHLRRL